MKMSFNKAGSTPSCQILTWVLKAAHLTTSPTVPAARSVCGANRAKENILV